MRLAIIIPLIIVSIIIIIFAIVLFTTFKPDPPPPPPSELWTCEKCEQNGDYNCINCVLNDTSQINRDVSNSVMLSNQSNDILLNLKAYKDIFTAGNLVDDYNASIIPQEVINCYPQYVIDGSKLLNFDTRNPNWTISTPNNAKWASPKSPKSQKADIDHNKIFYNDKYPDGVIMGALNQGSCGSCWIYSSVSVISDRYRIDNSKGKVLDIGNLDKKIWYKKIDVVQLDTKHPIPTPTNISITNPNDSSYTEVLNCISPFEVGACTKLYTGIDDPNSSEICEEGNVNKVCAGGYPESVMQYFRTAGAHLTLLDIPTSNSGVTINGNIVKYNPANYICETCSYGKYNVCDYVAFNSTDEIIEEYKKELYANGPFVVAFNVYQSFYDTFTTPNNVVYSATQETLGTSVGGHAVAIVGWKTINGRLAWIVRNSWGQDWGNNGFFLIDKDTASLVSMYNYEKGIVSPLVSCPTKQPCKTQSKFPSRYKGLKGYAQCNNCDIFKPK